MKFIRLVVVFLLVAVCLNITVGASTVGGVSISSAGAIVIDYETGIVLYEHNADVRRAPASLEKMMTVYLVYDAIANGTIRFNTVVPISEAVSIFSRDPEYANVPLVRNVNYTVDELLNVSIVMSACAATQALAELIGGSHTNFIRMMNDKAVEWNIDATFTSSFGLSGAGTTPRAMAILTRNAIMQYPEILQKTSLRSIVFRGRTYTNTNTLLGTYTGIDGLKTGWTTAAGANFIGTAVRNNTRIIIVTMGSTINRRFSDSTALLNFGFAEVDRYVRPPVPPYSDVTTATVGYRAIMWAHGNRIVTGTSDGRFLPDDNMTREQYAFVLWRYHGMPAAGVSLRFSDVSPAGVSHIAIAWADANRIITGIGDRFLPENNMTRAEMVLMMYRYSRMNNKNLSFNSNALDTFVDRGEIIPAAHDAMRWAVTHGLLTGRGNTLLPNDPITREQVVIILYRYVHGIGA